MAKYKSEDLLVSKKIIKYRNLWYKEFKYFLVYSSIDGSNQWDEGDRIVEYFGKASISTKPTLSSNHIFKWITEEELDKGMKLSVIEILKKL